MSMFFTTVNNTNIVHTGTVFGMWFGGSGYSYGEGATDGERFDSIEDACHALVNRFTSGYWERQTFNFVNRESEGVLCPAVGEDSTLHLSLELPPEGDFTDVYPDMIISFSEVKTLDEDGDEQSEMVVTVETC